jgi:glucose-6-phosphate 1-dehydrogenase
VEEYKKIFKSAFGGDAARFVSRKEVSASWKFIDPIIEAFKKNLVPLKFYNPHTYPKI